MERNEITDARWRARAVFRALLTRSMPRRVAAQNDANALLRAVHLRWRAVV